MSPKSTVDEIRQRFDADVERFSNLETGQAAAPDSPLCMELVTEAAALTLPAGGAVLDVGCGAGNYTIKLLERVPKLDVTLLDLSRPMLDRAHERVSAAGVASVQTHQADVREIDFPAGSFDTILAAAVLHHLRTDDEWEKVFASLYRWLKPGGTLWIVDLVEQATPELEAMNRRRYGKYLDGLGGPEYRDKVLAYVEQEDTPRPLIYQLDLLRSVGFEAVDVLHKRLTMAAFGAQKPV